MAAVQWHPATQPLPQARRQSYCAPTGLPRSSPDLGDQAVSLSLLRGCLNICHFVRFIVNRISLLAIILLMHISMSIPPPTP